MQKFFMVLGGVVAAIIVIAVVFAAIAIPRGLKLDKEATAYIQDTVPKIVDQWKTQELVARATPKLLAATKPEDLNRYFVMFSRLGVLKNLGTPTGMITASSFSNEGTITLGNYTVPADFEHGAASIQIQIQHVGNDWKINGFRVNSESFLAPNPVTATENAP